MKIVNILMMEKLAAFLLSGMLMTLRGERRTCFLMRYQCWAEHSQMSCSFIYEKSSKWNLMKSLCSCSTVPNLLWSLDRHFVRFPVWFEMFLLSGSASCLLVLAAVTSSGLEHSELCRRDKVIAPVGCQGQMHLLNNAASSENVLTKVN